MTKQRHQSNHELLKCLVWQVSGTVNILEANAWLDIVVKKKVKRNKVQNAGLHLNCKHDYVFREAAVGLLGFRETWLIPDSILGKITEKSGKAR